ncbi:alginate O-acetyltransferase AlgX-related protein [Xanthobacter autotrophicus]|uniref:alginate O-acetyltransferase AlgX-related protein n=1 Tax=Xanthobacter autotrophicus TaxID=280 RepID=UPI00372BB4ED
MTLLSRSRRHVGLLVAGLFGFLLVSNLIPDPLASGQWRVPIPESFTWSQTLNYKFRNIGIYLQDNFGFRATLPILRRDLREVLGSPDSRPFYTGRDGQLFWGREQTPAQSAGALVRTANVERFVTMVGEMQRVLAPRGTRVVVAIPPNAQSVEVEALPNWYDALNYPTTEYDLALAGLKAEGVTTVDLRAVLKASARPRYLMTDTHWNSRSSVLSFNAVMVAAGHPDWQVDPAAVLGPSIPAARGDLLRTTRLPSKPESEEPFVIKDRAAPARFDPALVHHNEHAAFKSLAYDYAPTGQRVLILGDSFTGGSWPRLFLNADVSVVAWIHESRRVTGSCDFNFDDVKAFAPDLIIMARTERFFPCYGDDWPVGLPRPWFHAVPKNVAP